MRQGLGGPFVPAEEGAGDTAEARRGRGRPPGSRSRVVIREPLGLHHFAFLRSYYQQLDLQDAWTRYLGFTTPRQDARLIERRRVEIQRQMLAEAHQLNRHLPASQRLDRQIALLAATPQAAPARVLPSLDEFRQAMALPEDLSERELLELYQEHYPVDLPVETSGSDFTRSAQLRALAEVERLLARPLAATDPLARWLHPGLAMRLKSCGISTLGDLVAHVSRRGYHWYRDVPRLGRRRADALLQWLRPLADQLGQPLPERSTLPPAQWSRRLTRRLQAEPPWQAAWPVTLATLVVPEALRGGPAHPPPGTTPQASDDREALQAWLARFEAQPATYRTYLKEVERFYLWCVRLRGTTLAGLGPDDVRAYAAFLQQPPAEWVQPARISREDPRWRPLRGPLAPRSLRLALSVLRLLFDGLVEDGYLRRNPWRTDAGDGEMVPAGGGAPRADACSAAAWEALQARMRQRQAAARSARQRAEAQRARLAVQLLAATQLRPSQLLQAHLDEKGHLMVPSRRGWAPPIRVGLPPALVAMIHEHHTRARAWGDLPSPTPVLLALRPSPANRKRPDTQLPVLHALGTEGLYRLLKRLFTQAAHDAGGSAPAATLLDASTNWLRQAFKG